jgi:pyruvate formate lyase activating enzyme
MIFGGIQRVSFIDYPGKISVVLFTRGCNFRCFYCHNPELVYPELFDKEISFDEAFKFMLTRKGKIDAVVFSGGEPTIYTDIFDSLEMIKKEGFLLKLDTNGSNPDALKKIINEKLVDFIAMDIKTSFANYDTVTQIKTDVKAINESISLILESGVDYEFRTTWDKKIISSFDIDEIRRSIKPNSNYKLQEMIIKNKLN